MISETLKKPLEKVASAEHTRFHFFAGLACYGKWNILFSSLPLSFILRVSSSSFFAPHFLTFSIDTLHIKKKYIAVFILICVPPCFSILLLQLASSIAAALFLADNFFLWLVQGQIQVKKLLWWRIMSYFSCRSPLYFLMPLHLHNNSTYCAI